MRRDAGATANVDDAARSSLEALRDNVASVLDQEGLAETAAMASEFAHGRQALTSEAIPGAARFAEGAGRHGSFGP